MEYIIGIIVFIIVLILVGVLSKKKSFKEIDRLEQWKIDIMNRPVLDEMSKVKQLNMTGQTEVLFERWRNEWDEVVTIELPDVEEYLFDAEEYIDKYRFKRAKEVQRKIDQKLSKTESKINKILAELNELIGSEEKNRQEIEQLKEAYREARKNLLAHRYSFGKSETQLELLLDLVVNQFDIYEDKTVNGNYLEAREEVLSIKESLENITMIMDAIPQLLTECQSVLPAQITELREGYREMVEQGYYLEHISLQEETERLEIELNSYISLIEKTEIIEVQAGIQVINETIEVLYDLLEKEAHAKGFIFKNESHTGSMLDSAHQASEILKAETIVVQQTYHLKEHELEQSRQLDKRLTDLSNRYLVIKYKIEQNETAHTLLGEELLEIKDEIETVQTEQAAYKEKLQMLRKDEMVAREKITYIKKRMNECLRQVAKGNIPGLPEDYKYLFEDAKEAIQNVILQLEQKPLDMQSVQQYLELAVLTVDKLTQRTNDLIENVALAEKVIQYGNRYKSRYPSVANGLIKAEQEFRGFNYQEALEQAAAAIEEIEPGALKKIEAMLKN
ncbi:septation ring formation regulator EzrA [Pseudoneobacillus rhizosphaerae]|uniref:Septation ring formation regulator EzrA n=1 Tax=Pseudoneobacillus rhizosphaerae TaxID=2880968 RepID=A0A9C7GBD8_9BACI|nr:septation ring formation regulator EzrA [Pseudoneobacillus rhizosphaerae]CAG9608915.1 Septation ring formation regulator EzrA [Pseudoneobacillus rhizosphaerae]